MTYNKNKKQIRQISLLSPVEIRTEFLNRSLVKWNKNWQQQLSHPYLPVDYFLWQLNEFLYKVLSRNTCLASLVFAYNMGRFKLMP